LPTFGWIQKPGFLLYYLWFWTAVLGMTEVQMAQDWQAYIHSDPEILLGKPVVKGTRLAVDFILGLFAAGWSEEQVLESYPTLTPDALRAVFLFSAEYIREEALYALPPKVAA
jgi:uncharacterized protein (DUF433 family)